MGLNVIGKNNRIIMVIDGQEQVCNQEIVGLDIEINGDNNLVRIEYPTKFIDSRLRLVGNNNRFICATTHYKFFDTLFYVSNSATINVGKNCFFNGNIMIFAKEKSGISINFGDEVLLANGCIIRTGDGHTIVHCETRDPLNEPKDVTVGNHVWIGNRCILLKGTSIAPHTIVGAMSLLNRQYTEQNVLLVGTPARIVKHNVDWVISDYAEYTEI